MNEQIQQSLLDVKAHLKQGGTYFDTLISSATKAVVDAISRSAVNVSIETSKAIGADAAKQFINQWIGSQDAEVPDVDPNNPLQKSADGKAADIIHPSADDQHAVPVSTSVTDGLIPTAPPGVPEGYTPAEEERLLGLTSSPKDQAFALEMKAKADAANPDYLNPASQNTSETIEKGNPDTIDQAKTPSVTENVTKGNPGKGSKK